MFIQKKKIINPDFYLEGFPTDTNICIGITNLEEHRHKLLRCGFGNELTIGERLLPTPIFGAVSRFNAEGKFIKRKDLPMETVYKQIEWTRTDWQGQEHSGYADVPYQRYQRELVPPPCHEVYISQDTAGNKLLVTDFFSKNDANMDTIKSAINVFLEIFGECHILTDSLIPRITAPIRRVQWQMLPPGRYPWEILKAQLTPAIENVRRNKGAMLHRFEILNRFDPREIAIGSAGFKGYVGFNFTDRNVTVLESVYPDNATYVFGQNWEEITQLTKAQVVNGGLHLQRIIHNHDWQQQIHNLLST